MWQGEVLGIYITQRGGEAMQPVESVKAVSGKGLEGDRYFTHAGTFCKPDHPLPVSQQITLIEIEAIEGLEREDKIQLDPGAARRNIITRGVPLNHLVGKEFHVGQVHLRGIKLCEPCGHLEKLTQAGVRNGLLHRGGLRAQILSDGDIEIGDPISERRLARSETCGS
jgi:MOSC domain-containing protein YiiM